MQEIKKLSKEDFLRLVRERLGGSQRYKDHAIVFVHGYNTSFDHAVYRTAQISYDLKFDGAAFVYSWPSGGAVASYTYDRESAEASEPYLRQFLEMVVKETGAKSISVIAHSMGNQPLLDVLKDMKSAAPAGVVISQVILAAPDVDADNFVNLAHRIEGFAKGMTLYAASNDRALIISRNFWQNPRAGDVLGNRAAHHARHRHDRRHRGQHRCLCAQSLGLCGEQQALAGHRQVDPERGAAARSAVSQT